MSEPEPEAYENILREGVKQIRVATGADNRTDPPTDRPFNV